jgi:quinol-cytochrome oxidoreductase complex cytochrome b subunit
MITDFLKHLFPRVVLERNLRFRYTFCLGGLHLPPFCSCLSAVCCCWSTINRHRNGRSVPFCFSNLPYGGKYLRSLHRLTSHTLLVLILLHTLRVILTGAYQRPRQLNWVIGCLLLFLALFEGYTGYLLPFDQRAFWATQTGMELLATLPFGTFFRSLLVPDEVGQGLSLLRFYARHITIIPLSILALSFLHFYRVRKNKGVLPYL